MELLDIIDLKELQQMQDMFSSATGLAAVTVDLNGAFITKPSNFTDFCMKYTRNSPIGMKRCEKCDAEGKGTYFCHAGLMDFAEPIIIDGVQYGNILGGQVLPQKPDIEQFKVIARELNIPEDEYIKALQKVTIRSESSIRAASAILKQTVNTLVNFKQILKRNKTKVSILEQELGTMVTKAKEITSRTKELTKISQEQRMLSINAAIEAGRAGEAGAGFRVGANEMGHLCESSAEIYTTIIQNAHIISNAVKNLENAFTK